ncbi:MAG TPA: 3-dehydroquinate synthase [Bryobacteraceae bacterium]|nr:3-dehydroquinate synthase [Bryobacteraceae bacterium]
MESIRQRISVPFGYDVHFTSDLFRAGNPLLASLADRTYRMLCVIDSGVAEAHPSLAGRIEEHCRDQELQLAAPPIVVPGGERVKNTHQYVDALHAAIFEFAICRHSYLMAVGGGAVLDMAGYAAATAHRGVRLIRLPTTVLSQNDSGVGVKNGINAFGRKNFLGAFAPPHAVINDFEFLTTLHARDWRAGTAEAVKVALIKDATFFDFLENEAAALAARDMRPMQRLIAHCAGMHVRHIQSSGDPFETGSSRPLDFGHWAAHKLEQLTNYELRHGEAVAIGIALDTTYSYLAGLLDETGWRRTIGLLTALGFDLSLPEGSLLPDRDNPRSLLSGLKEFREHLGGPLTVMLLKRIGEAVEVNEMSNELLLESARLLHEAVRDSRCNPVEARNQ